MIVIQFGTDWCQPCKRIAPKIARSAESRPDDIFMYVDAERTDPETLYGYNLQGVPTIILLDDEGNEIERGTGIGAGRLV